MEPDRWRQLSRLFHLASECDVASRTALLDDVCRGDPEMRRELDSLLAGWIESGPGAPAPPLEWSAGHTVGSYQVQSTLGAGGMSQVLRARDTRLNRDVALKVLPGVLARDPDRLARLEREAQMLAALNHPNIAQIYGIEERHGTFALVLELVDGPTLADRIAEGPLPRAEALAIARQVADALVAAHDHGIVHRDLKPANIKVRPDGTVKVLDFGIAKALAPDAPAQRSAQTLTGHGTILGTVPYMSPEQIRGRDSDTRVDIWAFGVTLYEMITGRAPFTGESLADTVGAVLHKEPEWKDVPDSVQPLLVRCLEKDPDRRLRHMADARLWLDTPPRAARRWVRPAAWIGGAALMGAAAAVGLWPLRHKAAPAVHPVRFEIAPPEGSTFAGYFAVSPDGRYVAFRATDTGGNRSIWLHSLESGESRALPRTGDLSTSSIMWSDSSRFIGFVSADGALKKVGIEGEPPLAIAALPLGWGGGAWNADDVIVIGQRSGGLMRVSANGGPPQPLTELNKARREIGHGGPRFLPDGRHFIYSRASAIPANNGLYVGSLDLAPKDQPSQALLATDSRPAVVPSGDPRYAYVLLVRDNVLLASLFDTQSLKLASDPVRIADDVGAIANGPISIASVSASRNGVLAYRNAESTSGVPAWLDRDGKVQGTFASEPLDAPAHPRVSPDGTRVAMAVAGNVWVYYLDGRPPIKLTLDAKEAVPIWTPDGRRLIYRDERVNELRMIPADRIEAPQTASPPGIFMPQGWTADGSLIAATVTGTGAPDAQADVDIVRFKPARDGVIQPVVRTPTREGAGGLAVSPDGRWLAYTSYATGREEIWVQRLTGTGAAVRVSANGGYQPRWGPGAHRLYYTESSRLISVPVKSGDNFAFGTSTVLFDNRLGPLSFEVAPDGRILLIPYGPFSGRSPIKVVLNWTSLLPSTIVR